ncbi:MAG: hypothetical protein WA057_06660 [Candidatus Magasanikiibacteriota bacterium]
MKLSLLQKYILLKCYEKGGKLDRKVFRSFYGKTIESFDSAQDKPAKEKSFSFAQDKYKESIITRSLEHLIDREFMTGFGRRTPHKWFITHVSLTKKGTKISQDLLNERQEKLPLK